MRSLALPARLALRWRRAHGEPTSQLEAEEVRALLGPSPLTRFVARLVVVLALGTIAASVYTWLRFERRLTTERAAVERIVEHWLGRPAP